MQLSSKFKTLSLNRSAIAASMDTILFCERFNIYIALIVNTYFGMNASYLLERSSYLLLLRLACLKKTDNYVINIVSL